MPKVGKKMYPYTREGMAAAMEDSKKYGEENKLSAEEENGRQKEV